MTEAERILLAAVARAVLSGERGELANQLDVPTPTGRSRRTRALLEPSAPRVADRDRAPALAPGQRHRRFADDGRDYAIVLEAGRRRPALGQRHRQPDVRDVVTASGRLHVVARTAARTA
jgi:hypothetical protein